MSMIISGEGGGGIPLVPPPLIKFDVKFVSLLQTEERQVLYSSEMCMSRATTKYM